MKLEDGIERLEDEEVAHVGVQVCDVRLEETPWKQERHHLVDLNMKKLWVVGNKDHDQFSLEF